jgi:hypothetical protein
MVFQASGEAILLGCRPNNPQAGDAYTGYWSEDASKYGLVESVAKARKTKGYLLLRRPSAGKIGHIAFSLGDEKSTVEAHSRNRGVIVGSSDTTRGWDIGIRLPNPTQWSLLVADHSAAKTWSFRASADPVADPRVPVIAAALKRNGYNVAADMQVYTAGLAHAVARYQADKGIVVDGIAGPQTMDALKIDWDKKPAPTGTYNDKYNVYFDALVKGGFYSADPDDLKVKRSIRTNNPGALNFRPWQQSRPGFVGQTPPDNSPQKNRTTIYRTPEHGVASWYVLLADRYGFSNTGSFTIDALARKYAGAGASSADVNAYVKGWAKGSNGALNGSTVIDLAKINDMLTLARAMYQHEIGKPSPLSDAQIKYGIEKQRDGTLPT